MSKGIVKWFNADKGFEVGQGQKGPCANKVVAV